MRLFLAHWIIRLRTGTVHTQQVLYIHIYDIGDKVTVGASQLWKTHELLSRI